MKRFLTLLLALTMVLALAACGGNNAKNGQNNQDNQSSQDSQNAGQDAQTNTADVNSLVVESGKLHMSTNAEFPPYEMVSNDGSFEGIDVEVAGLIAEKLGLELVIDDMGFTAALEAVQNGRSDMAMAGITVTEERLANMDFSKTYTTGIQVVIVPEDSAISSIEDLDNVDLIGTQEGTTGYNFCSAAPEDDGYGEDHVVAYETGSVAVQALLAGKVDCVVIDNQPAQEYVKANPGLKILDTEFAVEDYAIAAAKGNPLLAEIDRVLQELIADGSVQSVIDRYISAN